MERRLSAPGHIPVVGNAPLGDHDSRAGSGPGSWSDCWKFAGDRIRPLGTFNGLPSGHQEVQILATPVAGRQLSGVSSTSAVKVGPC